MSKQRKQRLSFTVEAYNVNVIDSLTPTMPLFRERPDIVFANGFE